MRAISVLMALAGTLSLGQAAAQGPPADSAGPGPWSLSAQGNFAAR
jgi:hypothetical protein